MSFYLSDKDYKQMIGLISGGSNGKNSDGGTYMDVPEAAHESKQQGIVADTVDAVQMGAWQGVSDIAHGLGALTGANWLHDVGDWAAKGADENLATMSDEMKSALGQNAFDGEDQGVRNVRWWAGNLGSLIGQNLDAVATLGAGKLATFGAKQAGKLLLKKEAAEEIGKTAVEQAAKRGIPQKYWNMVGITATMSAMSGGSRYGQKRDEVMAMTNEQLSQIPQFSDVYYAIADSEEGEGKTTEEIYSLAKSAFADKVGRDAALNPTAIATDLATNAVSGLGGGFWGLGNPAKTVKGGLLKGSIVEGGTEAIQGVGEQYALNKAEQDNYNPNKDLTDGMADNAINGAILGGVFGSAMGALDARTDRAAFNKQKRTLLEHINTGNEAIDNQLRNYIDVINQGASDLDDLVSASRVQALNNAGIAKAQERLAAEEALAQQQSKAQFESDFFGEEVQPQSEVSTFQVDPNLERALELHSILGQFRKNDLSRANEFIDTPTVFADEQARKDYVTDRAFDEVRNIAQSYGIDPKDGKAMRRWLENYAEKAKEYANDEPQAVAPASNLQSSANTAPEFRNGIVSGANDEIDVGNGNYQPFQYEVVDASTLTPTQQKDENQFRDRDRVSSQAQINNIARNLDPRKLAASPTMDVGAPLLALDGKTIIAGNGRTMAIRQAYQEGGADGYRQFLQDNSAQFGIDPAQLSEIENPVLVRRLTSPVDIAQVAINSNEQGGMRMSDLEQAKVDARRLPSMDNFVANDDGDINSVDNQYFIGQFIKNQPENVRNELLDSRGNLSQTGLQRIRNAMLYEAYGDSQTLSRLIENTDQGAKNVLNALTSIAPKVAQTQQGINSGKLSSDVNISKDVIKAVEKYNQLNAQGFKISDYLAQEDFVGDLSPEAREILTIFDDNRRSGKRIAQVLGAYFDQAKTQGNLSQASMFGDVAFDKLGSLQQVKNINEDVRYSFAGENAKTANTTFLEKAKQALESGIDADTVYNQTGWYKGVDGKFKFEIDNSNAQYIPGDDSVGADRALGETLKNDELYEAYPELRNLRVTFANLKDGLGSYSRDEGGPQITLNAALPDSDKKAILLHEVQHAIQDIEGFARGSSPTTEAMLLFKDKHGMSYQEAGELLSSKRAALQRAAFKHSYIQSEPSYKGKKADLTASAKEQIALQDEIRKLEGLLLVDMTEAYDLYNRSAGEVEARNVEHRINMSQYDRSYSHPPSTADVLESEQIVRYDNGAAFKLNESANSDFAKAVDDVANGKFSSQIIEVGTTPSVLKMLGLPDANVVISGAVLKKVMLGKHNVTAETLKQLPKQINDPVAVMKSSTQQNGYVVLTELMENVNGINKPIVAALHLKQTSQGIELINIASVYGRNNSQIQRGLENDLLYWNKKKGVNFLDNLTLQLRSPLSETNSTKGYQFARTVGLQLPSSLTSVDNLSALNIKTEADLSQYQSAKNNQETQINPEIQRAQEILRKTFGKAAEHIEVTTFANPPKDVKNLITSDVEGWFNPKTGKVTLIADSINATKTMSKEERLQFVAWHEMAHRGINVGYKGSYDSLMQEVGKNKAVSQIADAIQAQRKGTDDLAATNRSVAIEEAIAEIMAAHETGKWNELESRYGVEIKKGQRQSAKSWLAMTAQKIKNFLSKFFGVDRAAQFSDEDVLNLVAKIKESAVGKLNENGDIRFSRNEELTEERYTQAKENGETELTFHQWKQVRSPEFKTWFGDWENDPENASKVINPRTGEPLVVYHGRFDDFTVFDRNELGANTYSNADKTNMAMTAALGHWFSTQDIAKETGIYTKTLQAYLDIKDPKEYSSLWYGLVDDIESYVPTDENGDVKADISDFDDTQEITDAADTYRFELEDEGYDGLIIHKDNEFGGSSFVAFDSNQIKSATDNTGAFSKENDDIRFSRKGELEYQRDLIVTHNISADGIMHADKMGGLPLASVAVAKQSNPLTNFGEVTLIGSRDYIDPKGANKAQVFGSDIYSPRYPRISYEYLAKDQKALFNRFEKSAKEIEDRAFDYDFTQGLENTGAKQAMLNSDAVKHQFLKEHNIPYEKAYRDIPKSVHADYPSIQKAIKAGVRADDISSRENASKLEGLFRDFIKDYIKDIEDRVSPSPLLKNVIVRAKQALEGDKYAVQSFAEARVKEGLKLQSIQKVLDQPETLSNMRKAVGEHEDAFRNYVDSIVDTMLVKEKIWSGTDGYGRNKYVAHTIENVVKKLKKDLRGGESFNYGMPNVRAAVTPKFKSIADIQANKHRIVSKEEFETARDILEKDGYLLADKLGVSSLDIYDVLWNVADENVSKAFGYAGIKDTQENRKAVDAFLNKLKALPTEYFEGKAKDVTQFSNFAGAVVPDNLARNAYDVLEKSGVKIFTYDSADPKSRIEAIKQATNQLDEERGGDILFSRANTMQSALDLAMTGVADSEPTAWDNLKAKNFAIFKGKFDKAIGKVDEWLADSLRPVNDWIDSMHLVDWTGNTSSRDHEKRRLKDAMYTAKGKRDALNSELEQAYLKPILSKIAALSKETKKSKHPIDELTMKRLVGNWISARYSIEKNIDLLNRDEKVMRDTKRLLDNAKQNGTSAEVRRLNEAYLKAKEQYDNRKADIYNTDYKNKGNRFKVGVAGGWSIPEAELIMKNTEQRISKSNLESIAEMVYDLNQSRLDIDRASGRYTESEYQEYKSNRHYVPLTGDPNADADVDIISGAGSSALNIARDKTLKGRTSSEAEDAIDAVWKSIGKSTTYAGFTEFKSRIDDLFETEVTLLKDKGYSDAEAREQATANLGISKRKMQGLTRSSDNVLIRKEGGDYYEYELPTQVMESLRNDNVEHANAFLKVISKPTGWYARGVTQWTVTFAPMNMARDTWEKSEFIRVQKLYDKNNRLVDSKTMDKIGRDTLKNAFADKEVWQATKRLGFGQELRDTVPAERMLKQLLKEGGVSNYGTYLDKSETDLIKKLRKENNPIAGKLEKAGKILEGYNKMFDTVSALASYKALVENGIDSKQAAATTLELTNFRKTGSKMRGIKALYMFSQPTVMGAANLIRYLSTRKGQIRFVAYLAGMTALYTVLRAMDDDDEGGNKMDQLGDITRYIPIPIGGGHYFKIPVGFGMPQMAWNFSTNIVKGAMSDISLTEAGANMLVHSMKTFSPVSPSEISAAKYPMEKITLTATPTILQPLMQNVLNRSAFGNKITTNYVREDKLKAEQSKATTAQFWKDAAMELNDSLGIDMHPEQIKNLFDGYSSMFGSLKELNTVFVENPNREQLGRNTRMPFVNQFIGTTNEFAIQSRYYEASEEANQVYKEYKSRKERNEMGNWLDSEKMKLIKFHEEEATMIGKMRSEKAKLTRAMRSGQISAVAYESGIKRYNKEMSQVQAKMLRKYRKMEGLNTN
ncbi:MAG: hypothetical protein KH899_01965 [Haemophilus pittmaniae]|uniref:MuF-C-terminal domain-containing protein n=1 Tax=Haemophilus pittmaniae TaxID=249188 RepID=UPI0023F4A980|nr:LPD38 domain-containing protein [Haemophilus pittmaniae]MBS6026359.1 hypothetical protein [Haemophilus pittmaniae]